MKNRRLDSNFSCILGILLAAKRRLRVDTTVGIALLSIYSSWPLGCYLSGRQVKPFLPLNGLREIYYIDILLEYT